MARSIVAYLLCVAILGAVTREADTAAPSSDADNVSADAGRVQTGLLALYSFDRDDGTIIRNHSPFGPSLDLTIADPSAVEWKDDGRLLIRSATKIAATDLATPALRTIQGTNAITVEVWIEPTNLEQKGPARIVSISANSSQRNVTLGQDGDRYDVRLRTTETSTNGIPSLSSHLSTATTALTHVVYTRDVAGQATMYVNGTPQGSQVIPGSLSNWNDRFPLILANEPSGDRPWLGTFHLAAIYGRALSSEEVEQNFEAGSSASVPHELDTEPNSRLFEITIAGILSRSCLQCHDAVTREGGLDLSRRTEALIGGDSGKAWTPGNVSESLLMQRVEHDEMPPEGPFLTADEKSAVQQWIQEGAEWPVEWIDPAIYAHKSQTDQAWVRRLTVPEYIETVRSSVGVDISKEAHELLPPDLRADGFRNTAYNLNVDMGHVQAYAQLAELIAARMDARAFAQRFSKSQSLSTDDTMRDFIASMGKWLLRGPLEDREVTIYSGMATAVASAGGDYEEAVRLIVEAMLQSPRFIYLVENQRGDGTPWPATGYEIASRLSYIIWGGPPDEKLLAAADSGQLQDRDQVVQQAERMLKDVRAIDRSCQFLAQWLNLDRLANLQPNPKTFPRWNAELGSDMHRETLTFFRYVAWEQQRPLSDLFDAQVTFLNPRLAEHYGLEPQGPDWTQYDLSSVPSRGGLLTQGSVLTVGGDEASMVTRGLFVLHDVLRGVVNDPPPGVDTTPVPAEPGTSQREIAKQRIANASCGGCHSRFEPLAFGLEMYDGLGSLRQQDEHGNTLRQDGEVLFPGTLEPVPFQTSAELMKHLAESQRVREAITWKVTQFALGRPLGPDDATQLMEIHETAWTSGGTYADLIRAIVASDLVMKKPTLLP